WLAWQRWSNPLHTLLITGVRLTARAGHEVERDVCRSAAAALLAVRAQRNDIKGAMLTRRAIDVGFVPGIVGNIAALQVGPVPRGNIGRTTPQRRQTFGRRWIPAGIKVE